MSGGRGAVRCAVVLAMAVQLSAASLPENIEKLLAAAGRGAFWGIQIVDLGSGKTLYELNPDRFFVPASNTKLFTTALALTRLGPEFTFQTRVVADGPPDARAAYAAPCGWWAVEIPTCRRAPSPTAWAR